MSGRPAEGSDEIVVAAARDELAYVVINALATQFDVAQVVFERTRLWRVLRGRVRRLGWRPVVSQVLFMMWDRLVLRPRSRGRVRALLAGHDARAPDGRLPTLDVVSVNGPEFSALLDELRPRVVVVAGTGIISRRVLSKGPVFLNIHCGITPRYRGSHGAFWAVVEGRPDQAGTTVHVIDPGVDTGPVVAQCPIEIDPAFDTQRTLPVKQYLAGLDLMASAVAAALAGNLQAYQPPTAESRLWYSPTLRDHRRFRRGLQAMRAGKSSGRPTTGRVRS